MKKLISKKIFTAVISMMLIIVMALTLCSCGNKTSNTETTTAAAATETAAETVTETQAEDSAFYQKLAALEGVSSIEKIEQTEEAFVEKYMVTFTQPLDWDNQAAGTFEQRVEIGYMGDEAINNYQVDGYCMNDISYNNADIFKANDSSELTLLTQGNFINIEYRFFGKSVPEGLSNDSTDLWEYLTIENAAKDFKSIIEKLSTILTGTKTFSGHSKGGFTTNTMAYYYPDLCDAYVAYVAPLCNGTEDTAFVKNVYETIGNVGYTEEEAAAMRQKMLDFEVFCIENREMLQEACWTVAMAEGDTYRDFVTKEILFDMEVLNFGLQFWQYGKDFAMIDEVMAMPDTTEEEQEAVLTATLNLLVSISPLSSWSTNFSMFPYYVQAAKQMGENYMDFSYLREAVIAKTGTDMLAVTEDMEAGLWQKMVFTDEQIAAFQYDGSIRDELIAWSETTDAHIIMIYGGCDVWYAVRIPDTTNPNVHIYVQKAGSHSSMISALASEDMNDCISILQGWIVK